MLAVTAGPSSPCLPFQAAFPEGTVSTHVPSTPARAAWGDRQQQSRRLSLPQRPDDLDFALMVRGLETDAFAYSFYKLIAYLLKNLCVVWARKALRNI